MSGDGDEQVFDHAWVPSECHGLSMEMYFVENPEYGDENWSARKETVHSGLSKSICARGLEM